MFEMEAIKIPEHIKYVVAQFDFPMALVGYTDKPIIDEETGHVSLPKGANFEILSIINTEEIDAEFLIKFVKYKKNNLWSVKDFKEANQKYVDLVNAAEESIHREILDLINEQGKRKENSKTGAI